MCQQQNARQANREAAVTRLREGGICAGDDSGRTDLKLVSGNNERNPSRKEDEVPGVKIRREGEVKIDGANDRRKRFGRPSKKKKKKKREPGKICGRSI